MSDMIDGFRDLKALRKELRRVFGLPCPMCRQKQPKRQPTILQPQQRCKVDGYRDPRPEPTQADWDSMLFAGGAPHEEM